MSRVEILASELRAIEYVKAQMCLAHIQKPSTTLDHEVWSSVHDAMNVGHDRSFERLGWLLQKIRPGDLA